MIRKNLMKVKYDIIFDFQYLTDLEFFKDSDLSEENTNWSKTFKSKRPYLNLKTEQNIFTDL